jgi:excisionase family DNA binding protein
MTKSILINTNEAAGILGCHPDKVALLIRKGKLKAIRRKNRWMLNPDEVKRWKENTK